MDNKHYFINGGIPPQLQFEPTMPLRFNCASGQSSESTLNPNWDHSNDQFTHFDSGLSSMVTSPVVASNDGFSIRELIGKLGTVCTSPPTPQPPPFTAVTPTNYIMNDNISNNSTNNSCYSTPINSPPKLHIPNMGNNSPLPALSADPGFAMRAAKFSCFGSRSFNGRTKTTSPFGLNSTELSHRSMANNRPSESTGKLPRVSSSPSLKQDRSSVQQHNNSGQTQMEIGSSATGLGLESEEHSVSKQVPSELNSRKRKAVSRGKIKEDVSTQKGREADDDCARGKRSKPAEEEGDGTENGNVKMEESKGLVSSGDETQKQAMENQTSQEPQKDYIHVRARRGQATDSHSLAERVRREKIGERMKLLQDLVPGCNKVTGKALMLDEIINYVQSLQRQVEFLSMKLASVNPSLDFPVENLLHKNKCQPNGSLSQTMFQLDNSAASAFLNHQQPQQLPQLHTNIPNGSLSQCSVVDPLDTLLCRSLGMQLPSLDGFGENHSQFTTIFEDDLQSIVQMGYTQNPNQDLTLQSQGFPVNNSTSHMKIEM